MGPAFAIATTLFVGLLVRNRAPFFERDLPCVGVLRFKCFGFVREGVADNFAAFGE